MKQIFTLFVGLLCPLFLLSNGVGIIDGSNETYLDLMTSNVEVSIENQIAVVTTTQLFFNAQDSTAAVKYGFPLPPNATATSLRWQYDGQWYTAEMAAEVQDTIIPGTGGGSSYPAADLINYLGDTPLYYDDIDSIEAGGFLQVELQYVELLPYEFGVVSWYYPSDYSLIQNTSVPSQILDLTLTSPRTIEQVELLDFSDATIANNGNEAAIYLETENDVLDQNYQVNYSLSLEELGLYSFSTMLDESLGCDEHGEGYMAFIVEPDASDNTEVIDKVFTFVIDRSGSMDGNKIVQARNAASFIINNLNEGDYFNIVDFSGDATSFQDGHVPFNEYNKNAALNYISGINSGGGTNMIDAFSEAIPQFNMAGTDTYNILIFLTDGQGSDPDDVTLAHVDDLVAALPSPLNIFSFGIGNNVNAQFLTQLATQNSGTPYFLGNEELEAAVNYFYLTIQNPVLLNIQMNCSPDIITEMYPVILPNLYKGQQLLVVGRYVNPTNVDITFSGQAFGQEVVYDYAIDLADIQTPNLEFLPKLWAQQKIQSLTLDFYTAGSNSVEGMELEEEITDLSVCYGVSSIFTSFQGGSPDVTDGSFENAYVVVDTRSIINNQDSPVTISSYPNPFQDQIQFTISGYNLEPTTGFLHIFDVSGKLICVLEIDFDGSGKEVVINWDGNDSMGKHLSKGQYFYSLNIANQQVYSDVLLKF